MSGPRKANNSKVEFILHNIIPTGPVEITREKWTGGGSANFTLYHDSGVEIQGSEEFYIIMTPELLDIVPRVLQRPCSRNSKLVQDRILLRIVH